MLLCWRGGALWLCVESHSGEIAIYVVGSRRLRFTLAAALALLSHRCIKGVCIQLSVIVCASVCCSELMCGNIGKGVMGSSKKSLLFTLIRDHSPFKCATYVLDCGHPHVWIPFL